MSLDEGSSNLNVYVSEDDGLIHFTNWAGADSALPFSSGATKQYTFNSNITLFSGGGTNNNGTYFDSTFTVAGGTIRVSGSDNFDHPFYVWHNGTQVVGGGKSFNITRTTNWEDTIRIRHFYGTFSYSIVLLAPFTVYYK